MTKIYLDDTRIPTEENWVVVSNYTDFINTVLNIGFQNIQLISLDHDLDESAMREYYNNVRDNFTIDYNNITEKTGYDCAKWLVKQWSEGNSTVKTVVHSSNPIGAANIMGYINNYLKNTKQSQTCVKVDIPFVYSKPKIIL